MGPDTDSVHPKWLTWPAAVVAVLAWGLARITHVPFFDLVALAALIWLVGWLLVELVGRYLVRTGEIPPLDDEDDEER